jgi:hypothetical protein
MEYKAIVSDDVAELILDDHATFRRLFARIEEAPTNNDRLQLWFELGPLLNAHELAEERTFYPALQQAAPDDDVREDIMDRNDIRDAVQEADRYDPGSDEWHAAVKRVRDITEAHLSEEECSAIPTARKCIPLERRVDIGIAFLRLRTAYPSDRL